MLLLTIVLRCTHLDRYFGDYHGNFCDCIWNWKCGCDCPATIINGRLITTKSVYLWRYLIPAMKSPYSFPSKQVTMKNACVTLGA